MFFFGLFQSLRRTKKVRPGKLIKIRNPRIRKKRSRLKVKKRVIMIRTKKRSQKSGVMMDFMIHMAKERGERNQNQKDQIGRISLDLETIPEEIVTDKNIEITMVKTVEIEDETITEKKVEETITETVATQEEGIKKKSEMKIIAIIVKVGGTTEEESMENMKTEVNVMSGEDILMNSKMAMM